jgi:hypothetical protein
MQEPRQMISVLFDSRPVKAARRPFGLGILPPDDAGGPDFEPTPEDRAWLRDDTIRREAYGLRPALARLRAGRDDAPDRVRGSLFSPALAELLAATFGGHKP